VRSLRAQPGSFDAKGLDSASPTLLTMSQLMGTLTKKRKHRMTTNDAEKPTKRFKKDKKKKQDKGKARETTDDGSEFKVIKGSLVVSIPPIFASSPRTGVEEMLDSMVMRYGYPLDIFASNAARNNFRYIPTLRGVVLSHSNLCFLGKTATIKADCPFSVCNIGFDATVWSPRVCTKLGELIYSCESHVLINSLQLGKLTYVLLTIFLSLSIALSMSQYHGITYQQTNGNSSMVLRKMTQNLDQMLKVLKILITNLQGRKKGKAVVNGYTK
jgi:hypothetical protein